MLNLTELDNPAAGLLEFGYTHTPELIMQWIDICTEPAAHRSTDGSTIVANARLHRDELVAEWVAVWIEQGAIPPPTEC
jgi:hypothetical protein